MAERLIHFVVKQPGDDKEFFQRYLDQMSAERWKLLAATYVNGPGPYSWWHCIFQRKASQ